MRTGRPKGSKDSKPRFSATAKLRQMAASKGETPLEYMLRVMRDDRTDDSRRDDMAKAAAPYCHSKLSTVEHSGPNGKPIPIGVNVSFVGSAGATPNG